MRISTLFAVVFIVTVQLYSDPSAVPVGSTDSDNLIAVSELSAHEREMILLGPIPEWKAALGTVLSIYPGFGIGHMVQNRWHNSNAVIFTIGETASAGLAMAPLLLYGIELLTFNFDRIGEQPNMNALTIASLVTFSLFKIWEVVDAVAGPSDYNKRYREILGP